MIVKTELLKDSCEKVLAAISKSKLDDLRDCLEILSADSTLHLNITNNEYYVSVKIPLDHEESFSAVVNAPQFLKLISQVNNEDIELNVKDNNLIVKSGSSRYKLPMMFNDNNVVQLKKIELCNITVDTIINSNYLHSILNVNSKDVAKRSFGSPVQQMYYLDEQGCITFASGACVNKFTTTTSPFKVLLTDTLVKMFKLFNKDETVKLQLGYDLQDNSIQPKLRLSRDNVEITSLLNNDDRLISSVPVNAIRQKANRIQSSNKEISEVVIQRSTLLGALNRLEIFNPNKIVKLKPTDKLIVSDLADNNVEEVDVLESPYIVSQRDYLVDSDKLKTLLVGCEEPSLKIYFAEDSLLVRRNNIINIIQIYEQE